MLFITTASAAWLASVSGMDDPCCAQKVVTALQSVPMVTSVAASFEKNQACMEASGPLTSASLGKALESAGYSIVSLSEVAACPAGLHVAVDPWAAAKGLDVVTISHGDRVELTPVGGKYTIFDFGAPWCAPCHAGAALLTTYITGKRDVSARIVWLDAGDAKASFALPVVAQHLAFAEGLPWYKVVGPDGKKLYEGSAPAAAIAAIDRKRGR